MSEQKTGWHRLNYHERGERITQLMEELDNVREIHSRKVVELVRENDDLWRRITELQRKINRLREMKSKAADLLVRQRGNIHKAEAQLAEIAEWIAAVNDCESIDKHGLLKAMHYQDAGDEITAILENDGHTELPPEVERFRKFYDDLLDQIA